MTLDEEWRLIRDEIELQMAAVKDPRSIHLGDLEWGVFKLWLDSVETVYVRLVNGEYEWDTPWDLKGSDAKALQYHTHGLPVYHHPSESAIKVYGEEDGY